MGEEVELDESRKKEILDLERTLDRLNHFEVLGLRPGASPADVKKAFYEASRRYHPDRYFGKNLGSYRARVERIFRRLSDAQQILTDASRRAAYLEEHPELASGPTPSPAAAEPLPVDQKRGAERRGRLARHPYLSHVGRVAELMGRAKGAMAASDFVRALADLSAVLALDDKHDEAKALLASARKRQDAQRAAEALKKGTAAEKSGDIRRAIDAYRSAAGVDKDNAKAHHQAARLMLKAAIDLGEARALAQRAVELDSKNTEHRAVLAAIYLAQGKKPLAEQQYHEILKLDPEHVQAKKHLRKWWPF